LTIVLANMLIMWLSKYILINDIVFYNTFSEQISYERSNALFENLMKYSWIGYVAMPFIFLVRFGLISIITYTGIFLCDLHEAISYKKVFGVVIASEIVFFLASLFKLLWFCFFAGNYDLNDLNFFYPLSLINLFNQAELDKMWIFPLQSLNLFQIIYVLSLAYGIKVQSEIHLDKAEKAVLISYLPGLLIWVVFIMFFSISSS